MSLIKSALGNFRLFCFSMLMLNFAPMAQAQTRDTIFLWPDSVPGETEAKHPPIQTDNRSRNVVRLTDITNPALVVFEPAKKNDSNAAIIVCPGGGYSILAIDLEGYEVAEWLNSLGYTAFVLQYRVPQKQEGSLQDIQRGIRIIRSDSLKYNLDPEKIGVLGFSAGGSLCARASTSFTTDSYERSDDIDTLSSRPDFAMLVYPAYLDKGEDRSITPELDLTKETPPFFIFGTADDKHGNSPLVMATALRDSEIPIELHLLPRGGHGYGLRAGNIAAEIWPDLAESWLKNLLDKKQ